MARGAFLDEVGIEVSGGRGGDGMLSFRRTKRNPRGGPDGGNGGIGGSVYATAHVGIASLADYMVARKFTASSGKQGGSNNKHGRNGESLWLKMPLGTDILDEDTGNLHASLLEDGQQSMLARGGEGGLGNTAFKTSTNRAPREATEGMPGELRNFSLTLRLLADIGLVGLPNAGKSSLLNRLSNAHSEVGDYPFTTLCPQLGVVEMADYSQVTIADIPGIISGASSGVGLGLRFLRHIARTRLLLHLVDCSPGKTGDVCSGIDTLLQEMAKAEVAGLQEKQRMVVLTKTDLLGNDYSKLVDEVSSAYPAVQVCAVSSHTGEGVEGLLAKIASMLSREKD